MVFDEPRLPGVPVPGGGGMRRRETAYARSVDLSSSLIASSQRDPERSVRDARHVDLNPSTPLDPSALMRIRVLAPIFWSRRGRGAVCPHDARLVASRDATGTSAQWR